MVNPSGRRAPMRLLAAAALVLALAGSLACGSSRFFRQYEYEEEMYLSLDGTATLYVNSSVPALVALRGASLDVNPTARLDRNAVRDFYTSANTHVTRVSTSFRNNRRYVHVRLDVDDVRRLGETKAFAWSTYRFEKDGNLFVYKQTFGAPAGKVVGNPAWSGDEIVAFRLHLPSKIAYHNTLPGNLKRGNILVWEQPLADRLRGVPIAVDARMESQSILYRTLWLFGATFLAVAATFVLIIWWVLRRGAKSAQV